MTTEQTIAAANRASRLVQRTRPTSKSFAGRLAWALEMWGAVAVAFAGDRDAVEAVAEEIAHLQRLAGVQ